MKIAMYAGKEQDRQRLTELQERLEKLKITTTSPLEDGFIFSQYDREIELYQSIANSDILIVCNSSRHIDYPAALSMLYAMLQQKPIIVLQPLNLKGINLLVREVITRQITQLNEYDLLHMNTEHLQMCLHEIVQNNTHYDLSEHETILAQSKLRAHFREILPVRNNSLT